MELTPAKLRRVLLLRIIASVLSYCVFAVLGIAWVITSAPSLKWVLFIPLVGAVLLLPRKLQETVGRGLDKESNAYRLVIRTGYWLSMVRVVYLIVAIFILAALPAILS